MPQTTCHQPPVVQRPDKTKCFLLLREKNVGNVLKIFYFKRVDRFNFALSKLNILSNYSPHENKCQYRREVKECLECGSSEKI